MAAGDNVAANPPSSPARPVVPSRVRTLCAQYKITPRPPQLLTAAILMICEPRQDVSWEKVVNTLCVLNLCHSFGRYFPLITLHLPPIFLLLEFLIRGACQE